jgi:hypothetical protein
MDCHKPIEIDDTTEDDDRQIDGSST